jgi:uncharacterized protein (DUF1778 family)
MPTQAAPSKEVKARRIELRASPRQTAIIKQAAEASGKTVSAFMLDAAYLEAQRALADRRLFRLDESRWQRFVRALDRSARVKPRLRRLMETRSALQ